MCAWCWPALATLSAGMRALHGMSRLLFGGSCERAAVSVESAGRLPLQSPSARDWRDVVPGAHVPPPLPLSDSGAAGFMSGLLVMSVAPPLRPFLPMHPWHVPCGALKCLFC